MGKRLINFTVEGLNFNKFLELLNKKNIEAFCFNRQNDKIFDITIKLKDKKTFLEIIKKNNMKIICSKPKSFFAKLIYFLKVNLAYVCCGVVLFSSIIVANNFVFKYKIYGLEDLSEKEIICFLEENNYNVGKLKSNYNLENLQLLLRNNFDEISLVSSTIVGNTIIINIKEKEKEKKVDVSAILAPFNIRIDKINLLSGTINVKSGQIVKEGGVLVYPYINYKDGTKLNVEPKATFEGYAEKTYTQIYFENHEEYIRTGKTEKFINNSLITTQVNTTFSTFEVERQEKYLFKNFFLPIKQTTTIFYETTKQMVNKPWNEDIEQKKIEENEKILYNTFDSCLEVKDLNFSSQVVKVENYYVISTTISATVKF